MNPSDPLSQLRDIHLPEPVGLWPLAWGWWLLIALLAAALLAGLFYWRRHQRQRRYRQQAKAELASAYRDYREHADTALYLQRLSTVLRRTALSAFPRSQVAGLKGEAWLEFLDQTLPGEHAPFTQGEGRVLALGPYQPKPRADVEALHRLATDWIENHLAKAKAAPSRTTDKNTERESAHA